MFQKTALWSDFSLALYAQNDIKQNPMEDKAMATRWGENVWRHKTGTIYVTLDRFNLFFLSKRANGCGN